MKLHRLAVAAVFAVSFTAFAQGAKAAEPAKKEEKAKPAEAAKPPAAPVMPAEGKRWVEGFLGNWKGEATLTMGDQAMKGKLSMECKKVSNGWGTLCTGKADMGKAMPQQNVTFLYGWNIGEGEATMFEVTDMAEVHFHHGKWTDDKNATVTHEGKTAEGKMEKDACAYTWVSAKDVGFKCEGTSEGKTAWTFAATMKK